MPMDAFKAGKDRNGKAIYIGQVLFDNKLIPGKIHENDEFIHFEFYKAYKANETIKVRNSVVPKAVGGGGGLRFFFNKFSKFIS